jgi:prepilin-type N-terminal cleavage/methylation domain-containing protein
MHDQPRPDAGFSLMELLVAMVITLIVSGAIYGLMAGGQNAFRREPELSERQQSIRLAMDVIMRDVANAGAGLPPLAQVFTTGLGPQALSPLGPSGLRSDDLEMLVVSGRDSEPICTGNNNGAGASVYTARGTIEPVDANTLMFLVFSSLAESGLTKAPLTHDDTWTSRRVTSYQNNATLPGTPGWDRCTTTSSQHARLDFAANATNQTTLCLNAKLAPLGNIVPATCSTSTLTRVVFGQQVRYQIRNDTDGVPVLQRISTDDLTLTPQVLARGIEEMQVRYTTFGVPGTWQDTAPTVTAPSSLDLSLPAVQTALGTMINQVQVTLTSRAEAQRIQGARNNAAGIDPRLRGDLTSTATPRAALVNIARNRPSPDPSPGVFYWE